MHSLLCIYMRTCLTVHMCTCLHLNTRMFADGEICRQHLKPRKAHAYAYTYAHMQMERFAGSAPSPKKRMQPIGMYACMYVCMCDVQAKQEMRTCSWLCKHYPCVFAYMCSYMCYVGGKSQFHVLMCVFVFSWIGACMYDVKPRRFNCMAQNSGRDHDK